ncbi:ankyrin repeat domain-containing protein [Chitinophaga sp. XS-30]|uniref:ankyrin repeat domain-containing protein n=1 Tax=Chitinophaga sp. XS-30 TaxID=2604421 RepID=UPI0011DC7BBE|nr:ankyrin repeat domain-containing protein [Chitinophaga sp. XS-30]QEH41825.1 ankyrin repeat domain-containing protein [Chitinophaga sp. XS-30]
MKINVLTLFLFLSVYTGIKSQDIQPSAETVNLFYDAIFANNTQKVVAMLKSKEFPADFEPDNKVTPLQAAIWQNRGRMVEVLVEGGAHIDSKKKSAVLEAAEKGRFAILKYLLAKGGDMNPPPNGTFNVAAVHDHYDCARLLLLKGARQDLGDGSGKLKFLKAALKKSDIEAMDALTLSKDEINMHDCDGATPLITAVKANLPDIVAWLLKKGADRTKPETFDCGDDITYGVKPLEIARKMAHTDIIKLLTQ